MQDQTLQQMIREHETNMPSEIMDLIKSFDWKRQLRTVVNQNQLMIDIGADLEESVYLMILGVIDVGEVYERLMDVHELPEDKARKVIEEIEKLIFVPLQQKLMNIEDPVEKKEPPLTQFITTNPNVENKQSRDDILAEIEKEPQQIVVNKPIVPIEPVNPIALTDPLIEEAIITVDEPQPVGVAKPFRLNFSKDTETVKPQFDIQDVAEGVQIDSVTTGLAQPTVMQVPVQEAVPAKSYVADPYRESIE